MAEPRRRGPRPDRRRASAQFLYSRNGSSRGESSARKARLDQAGTNSTGLFSPDYDDTVIKWAPLVVPLFAVMLLVIVYLAIGTLFTLT